MHTTRRALLGAVGTGLVSGLAGCSGGGNSNSNADETSDVTMVNSQFDPRNVHVSTGATVTWTNEDSSPHTVTNASDNWEKDSEVSDGERTTHTFEEDGVYGVFCTYHGSADLSGMSMKIAVGEASIQEPLGSDSDDGDGGGYY